MASSPPDNPSSSGTCNEIVPVGDTNQYTSSSSNTIQIDEPPTTTNRSHSEAEALSKLIKADLNSIATASKRITEYEDKIKLLCETFKNLEEARGSADEYRELKKMVKKLKNQISSKHKDEPDESDAALHVRSNGSANINGANDGKNEAIEQSLNSEQFKTRYEKLEEKLKLCLLCFSVFPENVEINKRVMIYWWIGEGFVPPIDSEQFGNEFFHKLIDMRFIEPVHKYPRLEVNICKMNPFVRSKVIEFAKDHDFFDFRACLNGEGLTKIQDLGKLHALFNVDESILDFKHEWFSKMKNVKVLYLGRWQTSPTHHIEVEDIRDMKKKNANVLDGLNLKNALTRTFAFKRPNVSNAELPYGLIKLDLQCFPGKNTPSWLRPLTLKKLKKFYIRGGKFSDLDNKKDKWEEVEELRLKYLTDLEMDWSKLQTLFPNLNYLEKIECPKLTNFPREGLWMKDNMR